jgi:hypothetical protein
MAMSTHATRIPDQAVTSGTFEREEPRDVVREAHRLACEIERLLTPTGNESEPYGRRLARALSRSLIDHLEDLVRDDRRPKKLG